LIAHFDKSMRYAVRCLPLVISIHWGYPGLGDSHEFVQCVGKCHWKNIDTKNAAGNREEEWI
jgi:hypothetical protein